MHDIVIMESRAVPAAAICTEPFRPSLSALAVSLGLGSARVVYVPHPFGSLPAEDIDALARHHFPEIVAALTAGG